MTHPKPAEVAFLTDREGTIDVREFDHVDTSFDNYIRCVPTFKAPDEVERGETRTPVVEKYPWHRVHMISYDHTEDEQ